MSRKLQQGSSIKNDFHDYFRIEEIFGALISNPTSLRENSKEFEMRKIKTYRLYYFLSSKYVREQP